MLFKSKVKTEAKQTSVSVKKPVAGPGRKSASRSGQKPVAPASQRSATDEGVKVLAPCNICGGTVFTPGPGGRLSVNKLPPRCEECGSVERHRAFKMIFDKIRTGTFKAIFKEWSCLAFNKDRTVAGGWFASIKYAVPGTEDALDVQNISLPSESVDVVVCNHIISTVPRYEQGLKELARIISKRGFAFVSFPNPHYRQITDDWGFPKPEQHGLYRIFGADIEAKLKTILPDIAIVRVIGQDPVTGAEDRAYIISKSSDFLGHLGEQGLRIRFLHF